MSAISSLLNDRRCLLLFDLGDEVPGTGGRLYTRPRGYCRPRAQAILTMRGWDQSERFDAAWALVAAHYHADIQVLANVIDITPKQERRKRRA